MCIRDSFCYVDDLIDGMIKLMNSDISTPVNIGNPSQLTILELAEKIKQKINPNLEISYEPLPEDDPLQRQPNIQKAKSQLSWTPKTDFQKLVKNMVESDLAILDPKGWKQI